MPEERELTDEEQKAKEYVEFYYYWRFHYCGRSYDLELKKRLPALTMDNFYEVEPQRQDIAQAIYWGHPLSSMNPQFSYNADFTDVDKLFKGHTIPGELPATLLRHLYAGSGGPIHRTIERSQNYGMEILGTSGAHISSDGHLMGSIIAKIDLRAPSSVILYELSKLKDTIFEAFPEYFDAPKIYGLQGDYLHESKIIKQATNASFAVKDDAARAIGLWLWDAIDGRYAIFNSFAEAWKVICGEHVPGILVDDEIPHTEYSSANENDEPESENNTEVVRTRGKIIYHSEPIEIDSEFDAALEWYGYGSDVDDVFFSAVREERIQEQWLIPSRELFAKLGYSASDPSVFRRLYRNTKRCIEACEVLSLKD